MKARMSKTWAILLIAVLALGYGCNTMNNKITVSTVKSDIQAHLPIGSSTADVTAYLDQRKIPHSWLQKGEVLPDGKIVTPNSHTEQALIRGVQTNGMVRTDIQIDFKFDDSDSKLVSYTVREVYTGP